MRKLRLCRLGLAVLLAVAPGCQRKSAMQVEVIEKESPKLATVIHVADPQAGGQLRGCQAGGRQCQHGLPIREIDLVGLRFDRGGSRP